MAYSAEMMFREADEVRILGLDYFLLVNPSEDRHTGVLFVPCMNTVQVYPVLALPYTTASMLQRKAKGISPDEAFRLAINCLHYNRVDAVSAYGLGFGLCKGLQKPILMLNAPDGWVCAVPQAIYTIPNHKG